MLRRASKCLFEAQSSTTGPVAEDATREVDVRQLVRLNLHRAWPQGSRTMLTATQPDTTSNALGALDLKQAQSYQHYVLAQRHLAIPAGTHHHLCPPAPLTLLICCSPCACQHTSTAHLPSGNPVQPAAESAHPFAQAMPCNACHQRYDQTHLSP